MKKNGIWHNYNFSSLLKNGKNFWCIYTQTFKSSNFPHFRQKIFFTSAFRKFSFNQQVWSVLNLCNSNLDDWFDNININLTENYIRRSLSKHIESLANLIDKKLFISTRENIIEGNINFLKDMISHVYPYAVIMLFLYCISSYFLF